jgi:peroxiredoxin-like protein
VTAHEFELHGEWAGGSQGAGRVRAAALTYPISWPPQLGGRGQGPAEGPPGTNPEELLLAAAASCYLLTFAAMAERLGLPVVHVQVHSSLTVNDERSLVVERLGHRVVVVLSEADAQVQRRAHTIAQKAERGCMIARALHGNVQTSLEVEIRVQEAGP